jgi:hypothetical protein
VPTRRPPGLAIDLLAGGSGAVNPFQVLDRIVGQ